MERKARDVMADLGIDPFGENDAIELTVTAFRSRPKSAKKLKYPLPKPDASNYGYPIENALSTVCYWDDSRVIDCHYKKRFADDDHPAGVEIEIQKLT